MSWLLIRLDERLAQVLPPVESTVDLAQTHINELKTQVADIIRCASVPFLPPSIPYSTSTQFYFIQSDLTDDMTVVYYIL